MKILALDPATKCGWAHSAGPSGVWDLSIKRDESRGMRLIRFRGKLNEIKDNVGIDVIVFEAARNAKASMQGALVTQAELQGVLKTWCDDNDIDYRGYSPSEIKKHATGKGNASKEAMVEAAKQKFKKPIKDDNEADALWILDLFVKETSIDG